MPSLLLVPAEKHYFTLIDYFYHLRFYFLLVRFRDRVLFDINLHIKISNFCMKTHITKKKTS